MTLAQAGVVSSAIEEVYARLQSRAGDFLKAKAVLVGLRGSARQPDQVQQLDALLAQQATLEGELPKAMDEAQRLRRDGPSVSGLVGLTTFAVQMELHLGRVNALTKSLSGGTAATSGSSGGILTQFSTQGAMVWLGGATIALLVLRRLFGR